MCFKTYAVIDSLPQNQQLDIFLIVMRGQKFRLLSKYMEIIVNLELECKYYI